MSRDAKTLGGIVYTKLRDCGSDMATRDALSELIALAMHGEAERPKTVAFLLRLSEQEANQGMDGAARQMRYAAKIIQHGCQEQDLASVTR